MTVQLHSKFFSRKNILRLNDELRINFYLDAYIRSENELLSNRDIPNYFTTFLFLDHCVFMCYT
jgi:hypothetical protein